jgi:SAM-dependent methyltransferase
MIAGETLSKIYQHTEAIHNLSAPREVIPLVIDQVNPSSILDVGCGTGTWLKVFQEYGVHDYLGVDGSHLDRSLLKIPANRFLEKDLRQPFSLDRKFDLVISLEVAEHLDDRYADTHVQVLVEHGNTILFSAAIPNQGGQNHVNEQWPEYWQEKFGKHGFYFRDVIRPQIWNNTQVDWWYRQNIFLVTKGGSELQSTNVLPLVHPELFTRHIKVNQQYLQSLMDGRQGLSVSARIFMNAAVYKLKSLLGLKSS